MKYFLKILKTIIKSFFANILDIFVILIVLLYVGGGIIELYNKNSNAQFTHNYTLVQNDIIYRISKNCDEKYTDYCLYTLENSKNKVYLPEDIKDDMLDREITINVRFSNKRIELYTIEDTKEVINPIQEVILAKITKGHTQYKEYCKHFKVSYCM